MKFVMERDPMGIVRFRGEYDEMELATLKFSELDLWILMAIEQRPATSADYLLGLETIFRRHELAQTPMDSAAYKREICYNYRTIS